MPKERSPGANRTLSGLAHSYQYPTIIAMSDLAHRERTDQAAPMLPPAAWSPVPGVRDPKLAEQVAAALEAEVIRAGWPVGALIGSEEQLMARFGVGRGVLREAIKLAEHRQFARMRRGHNGGLVVAEPSFDAVNESLAIYFEFSKIGLDEIFGARKVLEQFSAALAASSLDDEHVLTLRQAIDEEAGSDSDAACAAAFDFHVTVAEATKNVALLLFVQALASLTDGPLQIASHDQTKPKGLGPAIHRDHQEIAEAIAAGDGLRARDAMVRHLEALKASVLDIDVPVFGSGERAEKGQRMTSRRLASTIAELIRRDIVASGWPVGTSLGFEPELLQRYGVSRAPFREAVRILESHSVVRMRRGSEGGMVVTAPDGREVIRAVSLYLRYRGMDRAQIREVREELEIATLQLAIEKLTVDGVERLRATLDRERSWPDENFPAVSHDLHRVIAELCGNRAIAFLVSIIMQLMAEQLSTAVPVPESPDAIRHAHQSIVDAMVARDLPLATRRMRKHLRALSDAIPRR